MATRSSFALLFSLIERGRRFAAAICSRLHAHTLICLWIAMQNTEPLESSIDFASTESELMIISLQVFIFFIRDRDLT